MSTDPQAFIKSAAFTQAVRRALFWDEDGDWIGAVYFGLLQHTDDDRVCNERTPLGEAVATAVVKSTLLALAHDKDGDRMRTLLLMMPCKYEDAAWSGLHPLLSVLADLGLLFRYGSKTYAVGSPLIHTWLGREAVTAIRGGKDPDGVAKYLAMGDEDKGRLIDGTMRMLARSLRPGQRADDTTITPTGTSVLGCSAAIEATEATHSYPYADWPICGAKMGTWRCELEAGHVEKDGSKHACPTDDLAFVNEWSNGPSAAAEPSPTEDGRVPGWYWVRWNGGHAPTGKWQIVHTADAGSDNVELEWGPRVAAPVGLA